MRKEWWVAKLFARETSHEPATGENIFDIRYTFVTHFFFMYITHQKRKMIFSLTI